jgi:hypothetical protein
MDPSLDLSTLQLTGITLINNQLPLSPAFLPAAGLNEFITTVDLRPGQDLLINVNVKLDPTSRVLSWTFTSIDPQTGQPPLDAAIGFLPPGGAGMLSFVVTARRGFSTGTSVTDQASVIFNNLAPMSTFAWTNTIDNTAPISNVVALPAEENSKDFLVQWTGTDTGSGIQDFTIYVSDNGGPFTPFQTNTTATLATFNGQIGHTYGFYSIARDLVGNVEPAKTVADTTTQIVLDSTPPLTTATVLPGPNVNGWNDTNVVVTLNSTDDEPSGTGVKEISYSAIGAQPVAATVVPGGLASITISVEGITTITFFGTDNAGNIETAKTITIKLDKTPPTITGSRIPGPNVNGWSNTSVTVSFACSDSLSGLAPGSPPAATVIATEGANQSVTGTCMDLAGNLATATVEGINTDKTPPTVSCSASPEILRPPNHKLVPINVSVRVSDSLSGPAGFTLNSVTSNEPDSGQGDIQGFVIGTASTNGQLRAERLGSGDGRVYTIAYTGMDRAGNSTTCNTNVSVPHDQGH